MASLDLDIDGDNVVIRLPGAHFGTAGREPEDARLLSSLVGLQQRHVMLDFSDVTFLTSVGLALLLTLRKRLAESGRHLALRNLQPQVHEVFSVTRLDSLFDVCQQDPTPPQRRVKIA